jgi:hypothetical protein
MNEPKVAILFLTVALLAPRGVAAQVASKLEADALVTGKDGELPSNVFRLAPGIRFDRPNIALSARGSAWLSADQQMQVADGLVSGTFISPTVYGVRAELIGNASRAFDDRSLGNDQVDVQTRVHVLFKQRGGVWLGAGVARPWRIAAVSSVDIAGAGAWTKLSNTATFTATFTNFTLKKTAARGDSVSSSIACSSRVATLPVNAQSFGEALAIEDATPCERQSRFRDLESAIHWSFGSFELNGQTGYRFGNSSDVDTESRRWASGTMTMWFNDRVAFVAGGGRQPANLARGIPARRFATMGMVLAYWPMSRGSVAVAPLRAPLAVKSFEVRPGAEGFQKIIIRVGGVETVDVMGDFSDWQPLTLVRRGRDMWELSIPMSPGAHQINVRTDGGSWFAPPGMPTVKDSYNGEVGLLVVTP